MEFLSSGKTKDYLEDIIHFDSQEAEIGIDLTVSKIYVPKSRGKIDFGGSEREDTDLSEIEPTLRNSDDEYGWWELESGTYLLEYNENLKVEKLSFLQPLPRLTRNSAFHPTKFVTNLEPVTLHVGGEGIAIKENSRVSRVLIFED